MRTLALLLLAALAGPASAQGLSLPAATWGSNWTTADTLRQAAVTALLVVDWQQTRWAMEHPSKYREINSALGESPSTGRLNNYTAISIVGHAAVSVLLPTEWRHGWQYVWIGIEAHTVYRNHKVGVRMEF